MTTRTFLDGELTTFLIESAFLIFISFLGAFIKDLYNTITKKNQKICLYEIFVGGVTGAIVSYAIINVWLEHRWSLEVITLFTFICGVLGFEIFGNVNSIAGLKKFIGEIIDMKNQVTSSKGNSDKQTTSDTKNADEDIGDDSTDTENEKVRKRKGE